MYRTYHLTKEEEGKITRQRWDGDTYYYDVYETQDELIKEEDRLRKIKEEAERNHKEYIESMKIYNRIKTCFNTSWSEEDFINAYKQAKGIEDRDLTEEEYENFDKQMDENKLKRFREVITEDINERMVYYFE